MRDLDQMAIEYGTDKSSKHHNFAVIYDRYFQPWRDSDIVLLELGIGGYHYADRGGESLRMWHEYFRKGTVVGIDVHYKDHINLPDLYIFKGSQDDKNFLYEVIGKVGIPDIIIDDASHINSLTIRTFEILFPILKAGGTYVIEDCHTSYWRENFNGDPNPEAHGTVMQFAKSLCDQLNYQTLLPQYKNKYAAMIEYVHFYKEVIVIKKL